MADEADGRRVAIVTGVSSGLGRATELRLARDGWRVALLARDAAALSRMERDIGKAEARP